MGRLKYELYNYVEYCIKMYKLIFDSDALIKLIKAKSPKEMFKSFEAFISTEVYEECVVEGKKSFFDDAFTIEHFVKEGIIKRAKAIRNKKIQKIAEYKNFGKGEISSLYLYMELKADAICSDDQKFLSFLDKNNVNFIMPADLIIRLREVDALTKESALKILISLKPFIKEHIYLKFKKQISETK